MENPGFPIENCTLSTCSLIHGQVEYQPSLGGNAFYISVFSRNDFSDLLRTSV